MVILKVPESSQDLFTDSSDERPVAGDGFAVNLPLKVHHVLGYSTAQYDMQRECAGDISIHDAI
jgi:hypothetical protein